MIIVFLTFLESFITQGRSLSPPSGKTISAVSLARSVAPPTAIPIPALASTGPSFRPSPTIAAGPCFSPHFDKIELLSSGEREASHSSIPAISAIRWPTDERSPVSNNVRKPRCFNSLTVAGASLRSWSSRNKIPLTFLSHPTQTAVCPEFSRFSRRSDIEPDISYSSFLNQSARPATIRLSSIYPNKPLPATACTCWGSGNLIFRFFAALIMPWAKGCSECCSKAAARRKTSS